jgi:CheY-like chemotaxis protein
VVLDLSLDDMSAIDLGRRLRELLIPSPLFLIALTASSDADLRDACLTAGPGARRFAQGLAATFMLLIGVSLLAGSNRLAWVLEAILPVALGGLSAFCLGSYVFHLLIGHGEFAKRTLPWSRRT